MPDPIWTCPRCGHDRIQEIVRVSMAYYHEITGIYDGHLVVEGCAYDTRTLDDFETVTYECCSCLASVDVLEQDVVDQLRAA